MLSPKLFMALPLRTAPTRWESTHRDPGPWWPCPVGCRVTCTPLMVGDAVGFGGSMRKQCQSHTDRLQCDHPIPSPIPIPSLSPSASHPIPISSSSLSPSLSLSASPHHPIPILSHPALPHLTQHHTPEHCDPWPAHAWSRGRPSSHQHPFHIGSVRAGNDSWQELLVHTPTRDWDMGQGEEGGAPRVTRHGP